MSFDLRLLKKMMMTAVAASLVFDFSNAVAAPCGVESKKGEICEEKISALHPTQPEVGYDEIKDKVERYSYYKKVKPEKLESLLKQKIAPVIIAPDGHFYLIDHHHTLLAFQEIGLEQVQLKVFDNWSQLGKGLPLQNRMEWFWKNLQEQKIGWYELENGKKISPLSADFPQNLKQCKNNRMRSVVYRLYGKDLLERPSPIIPQYEFHLGRGFREAGFTVNEDELKEVTKKIGAFLKESAGKKLVKNIRCTFTTTSSGPATTESLDE